MKQNKPLYLTPSFYMSIPEVITLRLPHISNKWDQIKFCHFQVSNKANLITFITDKDTESSLPGYGNKELKLLCNYKQRGEKKKKKELASVNWTQVNSLQNTF